MRFTKESIVENLIIVIFIALVISINSPVLADETTQVLETTSAQETTYIEETTTIINDGKYSISFTELELEKGNKFQLEVYNLPDSQANVEWSTSNKFAVNVSESGMVTAKNYGVSTITAKCKKKTVTCVVTVKDTSRSVVLAEESGTVFEGETYQLQVKSQNPVTYISTNESIATVNGVGLITGLNPGKTKIIAKSVTGYDVFTIKVQRVESTKTLGKIGNPKYKRIRRCTKNGKIVYEKITWATNKTIYFKLDGVDESKVKKCKWSVDDKTLITKPKKNGSKIMGIAQTKEITGRVKVTATATMKSGKIKTYNSYVYITSPAVNTKNLILLGEKAGKNRQQYITFQGIDEYSSIKWIIPEDEAIDVVQYENKLLVKGVNQSSGVIKAKVDGKTFKIKYNVCPIVKGKIKPVFSVGKTKKISISGIDGVVPVYTSRNETIATVSETGEVTGVGSGVTYIDVKVGNMYFTYRVEIAAEGMMKIIKRGKYILNNWTYSQANRMQKGYYDCSALVWKSYKTYNNYNLLIGGEDWAYSAGDLFDYLEGKNQIIYYGYLTMDDLKPGDIILYGDYDMAVQYSTPGRTLDIYHASLYAGNGELVELTGNQIEGNSMKYIVGIGRVVD